jgi:N-acetylglucosaminyldiphosphoundecaprenol N-acetyl-beta-D-mannosaminyltransferase
MVTILDNKPVSTEGSVSTESTVPPERDWPRVDLFGVSIDVLSMRETVSIIQEWNASEFDRCRYVVTPNVDHTVLLQHHAGLQAAYRDASLVLADGWPVVTASRFLGKPLPETVPGSDLVPRLMKAATAEQPFRVFLLGAAAGVGERAAANISSRWEHVEIAGVHSPPLGFENDDRENERIISLLEEAQPDLLVVGLGAPKQEIWVHTHRDRLRAKVALCVGATIDFLAGEKARAPRWMRRMRIEWLHRMMSEPKRLVKRYARDAFVFPQLVWREWRKSDRH